MYCSNMQLLIFQGIREYNGLSKPSWKSPDQPQKIAPGTPQHIRQGYGHFERGSMVNGMKWNTHGAECCLGPVFCYGTQTWK